MSYVARDGSGSIVHVSEWPIDGVPLEKLANDDLAVLQFLTRHPPVSPAEKLFDSIALISTDSISNAKDFDELRAACATFASAFKDSMSRYLELIKG